MSQEHDDIANWFRQAKQRSSNMPARNFNMVNGLTEYKKETSFTTLKADRPKPINRVSLSTRYHDSLKINIVNLVDMVKYVPYTLYYLNMVPIVQEGISLATRRNRSWRRWFGSISVMGSHLLSMFVIFEDMPTWRPLLFGINIFMYALSTVFLHEIEKINKETININNTGMIQTMKKMLFYAVPVLKWMLHIWAGLMIMLGTIQAVIYVIGIMAGWGNIFTALEFSGTYLQFIIRGSRWKYIMDVILYGYPSQLITDFFGDNVPRILIIMVNILSFPSTINAYSYYISNWMYQITKMITLFKTLLEINNLRGFLGTAGDPLQGMNNLINQISNILGYR